MNFIFVCMLSSFISKCCVLNEFIIWSFYKIIESYIHTTLDLHLFTLLSNYTNKHLYQHFLSTKNAIKYNEIYFYNHLPIYIKKKLCNKPYYN